MNIHKGDKVSIKPEFQDFGDDKYIFVAVDDMEKGRVSIMPINTGLSFPPVSIIHDYMIV